MTDKVALATSLRQHFPNITEDNFEHTSQPTVAYNCIAWAASVNHQWWWPDADYSYYWPPGIPRTESLDAFQDAYRTLGFEVCDNAVNEDGCEKIVIYLNTTTNVPTHAARLLPSGQWTSKLGPSIDISHIDPEVLNGPKYGLAAHYMKRRHTR